SKQDPSRVFVSATGVGLAAVRRATSGAWEVEGSVPGTDVEFWSIAEPEPGTLWLGTSASGVLRVRFPQSGSAPPLGSAEVTAYGPEHGLPASSVQVAAVGERLFFLTNDGLFRFDAAAERFTPDSTTFAGVRIKGDPEEWTVREDAQGRVWLNFGRETAVAHPRPDGTYLLDTAPFRRFAGSTSVAVYPETSGVVWLGGTDRLIRFDLRRAAEERAAFPALLRRVATSEGRPVYGGAGAIPKTELPFRERALRFEYAAPRYAATGRTEY